MLPLGLGIRKLGRSYERGDQRGQRQISHGERVAGQVAAGLKLRAETGAGPLDVLMGFGDALGVDGKAGTNAPAQQWEGDPRKGEAQTVEIGYERTQHQLRVRQRVVQKQQPGVRAEVLVEVVLDDKGPLALSGLRRIERGTGVSTLEYLDDPGGIADCLAAQHA